MLYLTKEDWGQRLLTLSRIPFDSVTISTFNLYIPEAEDSLTNKFLENLNRKAGRTKILVGLPNYSPCCNWRDEECPPCKKKHEKLLARVVSAANRFPNIEWRLTHEWHMKAYIFQMDGVSRGLFGGVNLSDSNWQDALVDVFGTAATSLQSVVLEKFKDSEAITEESVQRLGFKRR